jgi:predicted nucleic acid-binding protein
MQPVLLDSDTVSELHKRRNPQVVANGTTYLRQHGQFALSSLTWYEVVRGLKAKRAVSQLRGFMKFCQHVLIVPIDNVVLEQATELWATAYQQGHPCGDADIIIAATALCQGRALATGNTPHFQWIAGLSLVNWREPPPP